ncbi:F-box protein At3g62230-like [Gastrolobium bilobum]|uniref:F-box protein At3g62230-like n=1 Tax=Gastrolobium bilobum TaxID=150636 RepID=UPI002AAF4240|nr:F-box protein At3g62230-like [Gastrolobium bilobum]
MAPSFDMLSSLPDSLLSSIVSYLPFKEAVRTSVLSKSWENIFKATKNIEFNELFFVRFDEPYDDETREAQRRAFLDFATSWIDNYGQNVLDKFSLRLSMPNRSAVGVIERCIAFATQHGVKELELDFSDPDWNENIIYYDDHEALFELPRHVYDHSCLEYLKLFSCSFVATDTVNFHALKEVSLGWMEVRLTAIQALLSNCKMLEILSLKKCWNFDDFEIGGEILSLRKLVVEKCRFQFDIFKVHAPNLKYFKYSGLMNFFVLELRSMVMEEADLDFSLEFGFEGHGSFLYYLLEDLHNVSVLTVCSYLLQVITTGFEPMRTDRDMNVTHLTMKTALHENEFCGITFMLNSCPILERLTIELGFPKHLFGYEPLFKFDPKRFWIDHVYIYRCVRHTLKEVEIKGFTGTTNELIVLSYFIVCGSVLKKITINIVKDDDDATAAYTREVAEILLTLPKASPDLEISIS